MTNGITVDTAILGRYLTMYKNSFNEHRLGRDNEIYKWKAVKCFQDNWNIDAADFPDMLGRSLAKTENLLMSQNFFARAMIQELAEADPERIREMFRQLFDETKDAAARAETFEKSANEALTDLSNGKSSYQNPNAVSTYLWLRYPDKYYIYKYSVIKNNAMTLAGKSMPSNKYERMTFSFSLYDALCTELEKDNELVNLSKSSLSPDCWPDEQLRTLTIDVGYFINKNTIDIAETTEEASLEKKVHFQHAKNIIMYGPPGTGKTYTAIKRAVAIIEKKTLDELEKEPYASIHERYQQYRRDGLIALTTFHQSYGYEEFIEGIRPVLREDEDTGGSEIAYELRDGIFKAFCDKAGTPRSSNASPDLEIGINPTVWKVSLEGTGDNPTRTECLQNGHIRIGWDMYGEAISESTDFSKEGGKYVLNAFYNTMQLGDIVLSCYSSRTIDAIGVVVGEPEWEDAYPKYKRLRKVRWLAVGINEDIVELNGGKTMTLSTVYRLALTVTDVIEMLKKVNPALFTSALEVPNRVFIIDEINRGNISKIFGELITLIEENKRIGASEEQRAALPYSGKSFGVPENVYLIGTMNTADRSTALLDTALRRAC